MTTRVIICDTCAAPGTDPKGADFAQALRARVEDGVRVETTSCMNQCGKPVSLALRETDKDIYLFHSVDPDNDLEDALALITIYAEAEGGIIHDARPAGRLRHCLTGRIPR